MLPPSTALLNFTPVGQETGAPVLILYRLTELPSQPPVAALISFSPLLRCTFIYVCACRSFCSWFWGRVFCCSGWSEALNVNKADFRFIEICLLPPTPPHPALQEFIAPCVSSIHRSQNLDWGCKHLGAAHWELETEPGSSVRAVSALNHWELSVQSAVSLSNFSWQSIFSSEIKHI